MKNLEQENQKRPFFEDLRDEIKVCQSHRWPVEIALCPMCETEAYYAAVRAGVEKQFINLGAWNGKDENDQDELWTRTLGIPKEPGGQ